MTNLDQAALRQHAASIHADIQALALHLKAKLDYRQLLLSQHAAVTYQLANPGPTEKNGDLLEQGTTVGPVPDVSSTDAGAIMDTDEDPEFMGIDDNIDEPTISGSST